MEQIKLLQKQIDELQQRTNISTIITPKTTPTTPNTPIAPTVPPLSAETPITPITSTTTTVPAISTTTTLPVPTVNCQIPQGQQGSGIQNFSVNCTIGNAEWSSLTFGFYGKPETRYEVLVKDELGNVLINNNNLNNEGISHPEFTIPVNLSWSVIMLSFRTAAKGDVYSFMPQLKYATVKYNNSELKINCGAYTLNYCSK